MKIEKNIDLSFLLEVPNLSESVHLYIEPLVPLSMVSDFLGSYYKTSEKPSDKMLCGLFENILGWHFPRDIRKKIHDDINHYRKKKKDIYDYPYSTENYSYIPLLWEQFQVEDIEINSHNKPLLFTDYWSRKSSRLDSVDKHVKGCLNVDPHIREHMHELKEEQYKKHIPLYYNSPKDREYIDVQGGYTIHMKATERFKELLETYLPFNNLGYLGNSEGWIHMELK